MRLFLVARHGQSLFNVDKIVNGDPALDRGLSEQGIAGGGALRGQIAAHCRSSSSPSRRFRGRSRPRTSRSTAARSRISWTTTSRTSASASSRGRRSTRIGAAPGALEPEGALSRRREPRRGRTPVRGRVRAAACAPRRQSSSSATRSPCATANAAAGSAELNGPVTYVANADPYLFDDDSLNRAVRRIRELAG